MAIWVPSTHPKILSYVLHKKK